MDHVAYEKPYMLIFDAWQCRAHSLYGLGVSCEIAKAEYTDDEGEHEHEDGVEHHENSKIIDNTPEQSYKIR